MKHLIAYDVETTGLSTQNDFIIQLSCIKVNKEDFAEIDRRDWYIKPAHAYKIHPSATEAHGLTKEFIEKNGKTIKEIADDFLSFIDDCDFLTYNGNTFDIQFLYKDFNMFGYDLKLEERKFYDAYAMECTFRPRTLSFIYHDYTGKDLDGAHNAIKDVEATIEVFKKQQEIYGKSWEELDDMTENNLLTPDGSIRRPSAISDQIVFARGKYKDCEFMEIYRKDQNYIKWFMENVASKYTKNVLREYYKKNCKKS